MGIDTLDPEDPDSQEKAGWKMPTTGGEKSLEEKKELIQELDKKILELRMPPEELKPLDKSPSKIINPLEELTNFINFLKSDKAATLTKDDIRKLSHQLGEYNQIQAPGSRPYFINPSTQSKEAARILSLTTELGNDTVLEHLQEAQKTLDKLGEESSKE